MEEVLSSGGHILGASFFVPAQPPPRVTALRPLAASSSARKQPVPQPGARPRPARLRAPCETG